MHQIIKTRPVESLKSGFLHVDGKLLNYYNHFYLMNLVPMTLVPQNTSI